ncbi:unnamed protein product [Polarella glacialis]|uniref:C2H2-type domain-containing protein n=1 Tax=Polarella glacialis TaxID=89957 RepID=A0A813JLB1_POLGL|nr:unnamed protein product [Polarella glacialis]
MHLWIRSQDRSPPQGEEILEEETKKAIANNPTEVVCEVCGTSFEGEQGDAAHKQFRIHEVYKLVREKIEEIRPRVEEWEKMQREKKEQQQQGRSKGRDKDKDRGKDRDRDRDRERRSSDKGRGRDRSSSRRRRSSGRGKGRSESRSRSHGRDRGRRRR